MKAEDLINKHLTIEGGSDYAITDGVIYNAIINALNEAINYTHCCEELLCVKEDVDGLTAGKYYVELRKDKTHTKVVDDYGIETMYFSDRFVKPPKQ